jgi:hypothetical protein
VWIITAWHWISPDMTVKGFKKCCISSAVDGTDDDMWWCNVGSECEDDEGTDCEDVDSDTEW